MRESPGLLLPFKSPGTRTARACVLQDWIHTLFCCTFRPHWMSVVWKSTLSHRTDPKLMTAACRCTSCASHHSFTVCSSETSKFHNNSIFTGANIRFVTVATSRRFLIRCISRESRSDRKVSGPQSDNIGMYIYLFLHLILGPTLIVSREPEPQSPSWPGYWWAARRSTCRILKQSTRSCLDSPSALS